MPAKPFLQAFFVLSQKGRYFFCAGQKNLPFRRKARPGKNRKAPELWGQSFALLYRLAYLCSKIFESEKQIL